MIPFDIGDPASPNAGFAAGTPITLPGSTAKIIAINDSPYQILLQFGGLGNAGGVNFKVPSGVARIFPVQANAQQVSWMIDKSLAPASAVISDLTLETYTLGEELPNQHPIVRQISVGNSIVTNTSPANALEQDLLTPFVVYGLVCSKDGTHPNQLDMTSGLAFVRQADSSLGRIAPTTQSFLSSTPSATYFLDLNPDGTFSWGTTHSTQTNYLTICRVTTDVSANIATVTDERTLITTLLNGMTGVLSLPTQLSVTDATAPLICALLNTPVSDTSAVVAMVSGDSNQRANLYVRGADGYGGLRAGPGGVTPATAHLYAQASGWAMLEALAVTGALSTQSTLSAHSAASLDNGALTTNGSGALSTVGGQASAGSFGVPIIVAQALDVHVTATTQQTITTYTPAANGFYRASCTVYPGNGTSPQSLVSGVAYTNPHAAGQSTDFFQLANNNSAVASVVVNGHNSITQNVPIGMSPITFWAKAGTPITVIYQDPAGTPSDFVTAMIERLA